MAKANVGFAKKDWKPPPGYKSAIGKARDAARAKLKDAPKPKAKAAPKRKINAVRSDDEDTASDSDLSDGEGQPIAALRRFKTVTNGVSSSSAHRSLPIQNPICTMNIQWT